MEETQVSVLIPVYNVSKYLNECLCSIVNQTYKNLEIIIIDDGSTDDSLKIIKRYAQNDYRIKYISRHNKGLLSTRVELVGMARGKYFAFVDSDDWVEYNYIEKLVEVAQNNHADIVRCGDIIEHISENRRTKYCKANYGQMVVIDRCDFKQTLLVDLINTYYYNSIHSVLAKRNLVGKQFFDNIEKNSDISIGEDVVFNCGLYAGADRIVTIPDYMYHYRKNPESIMNAVVNIDKFEKRLRDCYRTQLVIKSFINEFTLDLDRSWNKGALLKIDFCVNEFIKICKDKNEIHKMYLCIQDFIDNTELYYGGDFCVKYLFIKEKYMLFSIQKLILKKTEIKTKNVIKQCIKIIRKRNECKRYN